MCLWSFVHREVCSWIFFIEVICGDSHCEEFLFLEIFLMFFFFLKFRSLRFFIVKICSMLILRLKNYFSLLVLRLKSLCWLFDSGSRFIYIWLSVDDFRSRISIFFLYDLRSRFNLWLVTRGQGLILIERWFAHLWG